MSLPHHRFVIVGAGLAGAATAWHLRAAGEADVLLLEKESVPGMHASGRNAAMLRESMEEPDLQALASESAAILRTGDLAPFRRTGGLLMGLGDEDASAWIPAVRGRARFCPEDGIVDVAGLLTAYLRQQHVRYDCALLGYRHGPAGLELETTRGPLHADVLVNAAGPWAGEVGDLPLRALQRHLFTSEEDASIDPQWPYVWDVAGGYYVRPESAGWLLCACDEREAPPGDYNDDPDVALDLWRKLARHQPGIGEPRIVRCWVGQRTFAADRRPVVGFDPRSERVFHVAGLGGHGVTLSWSIGRTAAAALLRGSSDSPLSPSRLRPAVRT